MLTGPAIREAVDAGEIVIDPYTWSYAGPHSYDLRLANDLLVYEVMGPQMHGDAFIDAEGAARPRPLVLDAHANNPAREFVLGGEGGILVPGVLYLGHTIERIHSKLYGATIHGRSSVGRLGMTVHQTAAFIDVGFDGVVTLEMMVIHPLKVYPGMRVAQVAFHPLVGAIELYRGKYQGSRGVESSKLYKDES